MASSFQALTTSLGGGHFIQEAQNENPQACGYPGLQSAFPGHIPLEHFPFICICSFFKKKAGGEGSLFYVYLCFVYRYDICAWSLWRPEEGL